MFTIIQGFPKNTTSPSVLFSNSLVQVTFGVGLPVALQNKVRSEPSLTVWSPLGLLVKVVSTKNNAIKRQQICFGKDMFWKAREYANLNNRLSDEENRFQNLSFFDQENKRR